MLFECSWVSKVPANAVETAEDDTEECEDNHARVLVTLSGWWIERRNVQGIGGDGTGCDDSEDSGKDEGDEEEEGEEGEKKDCGYEQKDEESRDNEEPADVESTWTPRIKKLPYPRLGNTGNGRRKFVTELAKGEYDLSSDEFGVVQFLLCDWFRSEDVQQEDNAKCKWQGQEEEDQENQETGEGN